AGRWLAVAGTGVRVLRADRDAGRSPQRDPGFPCDAPRGEARDDPLSRSAAHSRHTPARDGRRSPHHHADPRAFPDQLTMNTYTHVLPALQVDAAAKMNAILGGE